MGNCQAAEAAAVVIQHAGGKKFDRLYWSVSANEVMDSNPGHYVAHVITSPSTAPKTANGTPVKQVKLLRPDDTLVIGQVYQLISFEDVLKEFAAKKCVKLGKLLKESGTIKINSNTKSSSIETETHGHGSGCSHHGGGGSRGGDRRQWRPALQSISELGS